MSGQHEQGRSGAGVQGSAGGGSAGGAGVSGDGRDWRRLHLWQIQPVRDCMIVLAALGFLYLGKVLSLVTVPMLVALLLAYLFEPLVKRLTRAGGGSGAGSGGSGGGGGGGGYVSRQGAAIGILLLAGGLVVVPLTLGVGFAALQGASYAQRVAFNAQSLVDVVQHPEETARREALPGAWQRAAERLIELRRRAERVRELRAMERGDGSRSVPAGGTPAGGPATSGAAASGAAGSGAAASGAAASGAGTSGGSGESGEGKFEPLPEGRVPSLQDVESAQLYRTFEALLGWLQQNAGALSRQAVATGANALELGVRWVMSLASLVFGAFLTAFFFYFFCTGYGRVLSFWESLIPDRRRGRVVELAAEMDRVINGFVRGRLLICTILAGYYTLAYWLIGAPVPLILGPIVGALTLVPYAAGVAVPVVVGLMWLEPPEFGGGWAWQSAWWWMTLAPLGVAMGQQMVDDYVLTPRIQGENTGMDTPTILFASLAGGLLAGVYGLLVAIPVAACLRIVMREVVWPQFKAWAEGRADDPLPISKT